MTALTSKTLLISTVVIAGTLYGATASAWGWGRAAAASCVAEKPYTGSAMVVTDNDGSLVNYSQLETAYVMCAVPDLSDKQANLFTWLGVYGESPQGFGVSARACVKFWGYSGHQCGSWVNSYVTGNYGMSVDLAIWSTYPGDFKYLEIALPLSSSGLSSGASKFQGYAYNY
jgi:hypothetical protein